eukprot:872236-Karenia_brevis.AAC.1
MAAEGRSRSRGDSEDEETKTAIDWTRTELEKRKAPEWFIFQALDSKKDVVQNRRQMQHLEDKVDRMEDKQNSLEKKIDTHDERLKSLEAAVSHGGRSSD